jgi:hypothetical protein
MRPWGYSTARALAVVMVILGLAGLAGCDSDGDPSTTTTSGQATASSINPVSSTSASTEPSTTEPLVMDGVWELRIDRSGGSDDPEEAFNFLPEAYYHPIEDGHVYRVLVSEQGARVSIEGTWAAAQIVVKGERTSTTDGRTLYGLNDLAGGGRFVVWRAAEGLQGEFTVYGSGMPILSSERGALIRDTSANGAPTTVTSALLDQEETARAEAALIAFFEAWVAKDSWKLARPYAPPCDTPTRIEIVLSGQSGQNGHFICRRMNSLAPGSTP